MRISMISEWSFWGSSRGGLEKEPEKKVADVDLGKERASTSTNSTFSPLRLLLLTSLFWAVRGQGLGPYPAAFDLSTLNGANGFAIPGEAAGDESGRSVSSAGDFNGDGLSDLVIGANLADPSGKSAAGTSYVLFGSRTPIPGGLFDLSTLNGSNGFAVLGEAAGDRSGVSISSAGDLNGDGLSDLVIGAYFASPSGKSEAGISYVLFGSRTPIPGGLIDLSTLNGTNGFAIPGEAADDRSGFSVSSAGDFNGDGLSDLVIGAYWAGPPGKSKAGKIYIIFGARTPIPGGLFDLSTLNGANGFAIPGEATGDRSGTSVSSAGDVNGDGLSDLAIGASRASPSGKNRAGRSYVLFGSRTAMLGDLFDLSTLNGSNGFVIPGETAFDNSGRSVSSVGDLNGDGLSDLVIGANLADPSGKMLAGKSYIIFGTRTLRPGGLFDLSTLNGTNGFAIPGETAEDQSGYSVSSAGDLNGDGLSDLVIGAMRASPSGKSRAGKSYVIFGTRTPMPGGLFDLSTLNGANGFAILGEAAGDESGYSVFSAGDVNGDGLSDLVIGAYFAAPSGKSKAGKSYIIFGRNQMNDTPPVATQDFQPSSTLSPQPKSLTTTDSTSTDTSQILPSTIDGTSTFSATSRHSSNTATISYFVVGSSPASSPILIGGIVAGVITCACSLLGGLALMLKKQSGAKEEASSSQLTQPDPAIPADYADISQIAPEMQSARVENEYAIIQTKEASGYSQWPSKPIDAGVNHYHKGELEELNRGMDEYQKIKEVKEAQLHAGYDDLPTV